MTNISNLDKFSFFEKFLSYEDMNQLLIIFFYDFYVQVSPKWSFSELISNFLYYTNRRQIQHDFIIEKCIELNIISMQLAFEFLESRSMINDIVAATQLNDSDALHNEWSNFLDKMIESRV